MSVISIAKPWSRSVIKALKIALGLLPDMRVEVGDELVVLRPHEPITYSTRTKYSRAIKEFSTGDSVPACLIVNCANVRHIDSYGVMLLCSLLKSPSDSGGRILVCGLPTESIRLLKDTSSLWILEIRNTEEEALVEFGCDGSNIERRDSYKRFRPFHLFNEAISWTPFVVSCMFMALISLAVPNIMLDDIGACIPVGQQGVVSSKLEWDYPDRGEVQGVYEVTYRLEDGTTCEGVLTQHDHRRVYVGSRVTRSSRSPLCQKVFDLSCPQVVKQVFFFLLLFPIVTSVLLSIALPLRRLARCYLDSATGRWCTRTWQVIVHDPGSELSGPWLVVSMLVTAVALWFGIWTYAAYGRGFEDPVCVALKMIGIASILPVPLIVRPKVLAHKLRRMSLGALLLALTVIVFHFVLGMDLERILKDVLAMLTG